MFVVVKEGLLATEITRSLFETVEDAKLFLSDVARGIERYIDEAPLYFEGYEEFDDQYRQVLSDYIYGKEAYRPRGYCEMQIRSRYGKCHFARLADCREFISDIVSGRIEIREECMNILMNEKGEVFVIPFPRSVNHAGELYLKDVDMKVSNDLKSFILRSEKIYAHKDVYKVEHFISDWILPVITTGKNRWSVYDMRKFLYDMTNGFYFDRELNYHGEFVDEKYDLPIHWKPMLLALANQLMYHVFELAEKYEIVQGLLGGSFPAGVREPAIREPWHAQFHHEDRAKVFVKYESADIIID